jgi:hypothetical protein
MIEKELGVFNFAFQMREIMSLNEFVEIGMKSLGLQACQLINKPGKYAFKLMITQFNDKEPKAQEAQIEQKAQLMKCVNL